MDIVPQPQWEGLAARLGGRTALLMGRSDTGKTTLARYLMRELLPGAAGVCFVDADVGQSSLGPPGTISMRTFHAVEDLSGTGYDLMRFAGTVNPSWRIPEVISLTARTVEDARASGAGAVIIDTSGLIDGEVGKGLKLGKIRAVGPDIVVAIEREGELEHILQHVRGPEIVRLEAGPARQKTRAARVQYRRARLMEYFRNSRAVEFPAGRVSVEVRGDRLDVRHAAIGTGTVVGLNTARETLALGVFEGLLKDKVLIRTPLESAERVGIVDVGDFTFEEG